MKKKLQTIAVFIMVLALGFSVLTTASFATDINHVKHSEGNVEIQSIAQVMLSPDLHEVVKGLLIKGTKVTVVEKNFGGWYRVTADELDGWVYGIKVGDKLYPMDSISDEEKAKYEEEQDRIEHESAREALVTDIIAYAKSYLGKPYCYGATGPNSFDCSGFLYRVFGDMGIDVPRSSRDYGSFGTTVSLAEAKAGDVLVFASSGGRIHHVGIYIGDDKFIHSACSTGVTITSIYDEYWQPRIYLVKRIIQ